MTSWERNAVGVGLGLVVWIIAGYGQPAGSLGWGRLIVWASATLSVVVCGASLTNTARWQRASNSGTSALHSLLASCAIPLLGIHLLRAFAAIYLGSEAPWFIVDAAIVGLSAGQCLLLIVAWPTLLPPARDDELLSARPAMIVGDPPPLARQTSSRSENPADTPVRTPRGQAPMAEGGSIPAAARTPSSKAAAGTLGSIAFGVGAVIVVVGIGITGALWLGTPETPALACTQPANQSAAAMPAAETAAPIARDEPAAIEITQPRARTDREAPTAASEARPARDNRPRAPPRRGSP